MQNQNARVTDHVDRVGGLIGGFFYDTFSFHDHPAFYLILYTILYI